MGNKINIAELLKDCPMGMELDCVMYDNLYFKCIREHPIYPIVCYTIDSKGEKNEISFNWYGKHTPIDTAKCVIFPKGKTTWKGFQRPFKDGDIVAIGGKVFVQVFIFKEYIKDRNNYACCYMMLDNNETLNIELGNYYVTRLATEEEKQKLFQAIKDNGYKWNAETKTLEKLEQPQFHEGDWITIDKPCQIIDIDYNGNYLVQYCDNAKTHVLSKNFCESHFHLWTIKDAKDGDVLAFNDDIIVIFKDLYNKTTFYSYCHFDDGVFSVNEKDVPDWWNGKGFKPANKEQRNILFDKMKEAGFEWNSETKTLEKLIEPKFKDGDIIYNQCIKATAIFYKQINDNTISHCFLNVFKELKIQHKHCKLLNDWRLATEEEKQKLFEAIKAHGYKWNSESKTLEKLVEPKFKVGDVVISAFGDIHLLRTEDSSYCAYRHKRKTKLDSTITTNITVVRLATEEEKEKLFDAIKENGYRWNAETKTLEKLPRFKAGSRIKYKNGKDINGVEQGVILSITDEAYDVAVTNDMGFIIPIANQDNWELVPNKFDITTLKPFESRVLVRNANNKTWRPTIFGCYRENKYEPFYVLGGTSWKQCIPYEENELLLGTTNDCDEYYKTWKSI